jgi:hypothetical protein|uniref:Uncharacterized protein n=1 Tax=Zea mays TaxID=4577 RepID=B6TRF0_MAIZE|nr:hypothetical protein [Zea mays]
MCGMVDFCDRSGDEQSLWTRVSDTTKVVFDDQTLGCLSSQFTVLAFFAVHICTRLVVFISCYNAMV